MGGYKWTYQSPNIAHNYSFLLITLHQTTHEPPSRVSFRVHVVGLAVRLGHDPGPEFV